MKKEEKSRCDATDLHGILHEVHKNTPGKFHMCMEDEAFSPEMVGELCRFVNQLNVEQFELLGCKNMLINKAYFSNPHVDAFQIDSEDTPPTHVLPPNKITVSIRVTKFDHKTLREFIVWPQKTLILKAHHPSPGIIEDLTLLFLETEPQYDLFYLSLSNIGDFIHLGDCNHPQCIGKSLQKCVSFKGIFENFFRACQRVGIVRVATTDITRAIPYELMPNLRFLEFENTNRRSKMATFKTLSDMRSFTFLDLEEISIQTTTDEILKLLCLLLEGKTMPKLDALEIGEWGTDEITNRRLLGIVSRRGISLKAASPIPQTIIAKKKQRTKTSLPKDKPAVVASLAASGSVNPVSVASPSTLAKITYVCDGCESKPIKEDELHYELVCLSGHASLYHKKCKPDTSSACQKDGCSEKWATCCYLSISKGDRSVRHTETLNKPVVSITEEPTVVELENDDEERTEDGEEEEEPDPVPVDESPSLVVKKEPPKEEKFIFFEKPVVLTADTDRMPDLAKEFVVAKISEKKDAPKPKAVMDKPAMVLSRVLGEGYYVPRDQCEKALAESLGSVDLAVAVIVDKQKKLMKRNIL